MAVLVMFGMFPFMTFAFFVSAVTQFFFDYLARFLLQSPGFLVFSGFGQFMDFSFSFMDPALERIFVVLPIASFGVLAFAGLVPFASSAIAFFALTVFR